MEPGTLELGVIEPGASENCAVEPGVLEIRTLEPGTLEICVVEPDVLELRLLEVSIAKVRVAQIELNVSCATEHCEGSLYVGSSRLESALSFLLVRSAQRPGSMAADVGGQDLGNDGPVVGRVTGDSFQRVATSNGDLRLVFGAELLDGFGVAVGDLALE